MVIKSAAMGGIPLPAVSVDRGREISAFVIVVGIRGIRIRGIVGMIVGMIVVGIREIVWVWVVRIVQILRVGRIMVVMRVPAMRVPIVHCEIQAGCGRRFHTLMKVGCPVMLVLINSPICSLMGMGMVVGERLRWIGNVGIESPQHRIMDVIQLRQGRDTRLPADFLFCLKRVFAFFIEDGFTSLRVVGDYEIEMLAGMVGNMVGNMVGIDVMEEAVMG